MFAMPLEEAASTRSQQEQSFKAETSATLATLPTETLELIFKDFCLHCCYTSKAHTDVTVTDASSPLDAYSHGQHQLGHQPKPGNPSCYSLGRHALFSLCLMCRRLRDIAQPFLYHEFALGAGDSWRSTRYTWEGRLPSFLRTIAERRDLAGLVRRVFVHPFLLERWCAMVDGELDPAGAVAANATLHASARLLGIRPGHYLGHFPTPPPGINEEMLRIMSSQLMGLVVAALPNMERLSLQSSRFSLQIPTAALDVAGFTGLHLKTLEVSSRPSEDSQSPRMFKLHDEANGVLERVRNLSTLNLHMCCPSKFTPSLRKLRVLRITHSRPSRGDLAAILYECPRLDTFFYEEAYSGVSRPDGHPAEATHLGGNSNFDPFDAVIRLASELSSYDFMSRSLHLRNETLKSLHLDFRNRAVHSSGHDRLSHRIPHLKGFTALEHVFLNPDMILPSRYVGDERLATNYLTRLLPPTIVTLQLAGRLGRERRPGLTRALLGLAQAVSVGEFAQLREVSCDTAEKDAAGDGEQEAARLFENAKVCFGYRDWPLSNAAREEGDFPPPLEMDE